MKSRYPLAVAVLALLGAVAGPPRAEAATSACAAAKLKAVGKKASCLLTLDAKDAGKGGGVDTTKEMKCMSALASAFTKAEAKPPCPTTGDASARENDVDDFRSTIDGLLEVPTLPNTCQGAKLKAAAKKAKCLLGVYSTAAKKGSAPDATKLQKCRDALTKAFTKAEAKPPCNTTGDANNVETTIDDFATSVNGALLPTTTTSPTTTTTGATTTTTGATTTTTSGPPPRRRGHYHDDGATTTTTGATTTTTGATTTTTGATTTTTGATTTTTGATTTTTGATTTTTGATTTTTSGATTTTTTSTTTTTTAVFAHLVTTNVTGTSFCGGAGLSPGPSAPFGGAIFSDTACTTANKLSDLGLACLDIGGGNATSVPPGPVVDGASNVFDISGSTLLASNGTGKFDCTKGAGPGKHCIGPTNNGAACTSDTGCDISIPGSCALDANCLFGPPLPIPNGGLSTCVINVIQTDASGTDNLSTGASTVDLPLFSRTHLTGNATSPCPKCISGTCNAGPRAGLACTPVGTQLTTHDCPPAPSGLLAPFPVPLSLSTSGSSKTAADGNFCPGQSAAGNPFGFSGAFGFGGQDAATPSPSASRRTGAARVISPTATRIRRCWARCSASRRRGRRPSTVRPTCRGLAESR